MVRRGLIWSVIILAAVIALSVYGQLNIPADAQVAVHWGISGEPDRYAGPLEALWIMPALVAVMTGAFAIIPFIEPRRGHLLQSSRLYVTVWLGTMLILALAHAFIVLIALGFDLPVAQGVMAMVGLLFIAVGNLLGKSQSNFFLGIRTPWTLSSNEAWDKTHRLAGRLWVLGGLVMVAVAFFVPPPGLVYVLLAVIAVMSGVPLVASYFFWRRATDKQIDDA